MSAIRREDSRFIQPASSLQDGFRTTMARLASGVAIVTVSDSDGTPRGLTVTSIASFSVDPPSILVSIGRETKSHSSLVACTSFAVQLLALHQTDLALDFAKRDDEKFDRHAWYRSSERIPLLEGVIATLICRREKTFHHGDHSIVIGEVVDCSHEDNDPLIYLDRRFFGPPPA